MHRKEDDEGACGKARAERCVSGHEAPTAPALQAEAVEDGKRRPDDQGPGETKGTQHPAQTTEQSRIAGEHGPSAAKQDRADDGKQEGPHPEGRAGKPLPPPGSAGAMKEQCLLRSARQRRRAESRSG